MTRFTSLVGIRYTLLNGSASWKLFWIGAIFLGTGCSVYHLNRLFLVFREHTIKTTINHVHSRTQRFPHVTICNLNHLRRSLVAQNSIYAVISGLKRKQGKDYVKDGQDVFNTLEKMGQKEILNQMATELKTRQSHQLDTMLISCMFDNQPCNVRFLYVFICVHGLRDLSFLYVVVLDCKLSVFVDGLRMELFVELNEYIGKFSSTSGFKLLVHDTNSVPFPVEDGVIVSPGTHTQIAFKKTVIHNVRYPFGNCRDGETRKYFTEQCSKSCLQEHLLSHCKCYDPRYSFGTDFNLRTKLLGQCDSTQSEKCANEITKQYNAGGICVEECPLRCMNNFVKLDVFYNQLNNILIDKHPSYSYSPSKPTE
ncbi:hypothetical protein LOTGIDRAFT_154486 [Lottia gigantea]|uniref:Amiloride-sensitive sodium channel n=1 Tax=Lottia gigantea TaxID=225164 RepID=V3ZE53_LOTGI|nr:hypothetical protein LOTGIDRAFT_154486 [Lottia gigantea]ESO89378.1 hypothetical protein LOTGIDRAFT_154486 [Lottia gigantea]